MIEKKRDTGVEGLGQQSWGSHIAAFYESKNDFLHIVIPYFKAGLANNEQCTWILSENIRSCDVEGLLRDEIPEAGKYISSGQLKVIPSGSMLLDDVIFLPDPTLQYWLNEEKEARDKGFDGIRISQSGNWADQGGWTALGEYEEMFDRITGRGNILALCTFSLKKLGIVEILAMGIHHSVIISKEQQQESVSAFFPISYSKILEKFSGYFYSKKTVGAMQDISV